MVCNWSGTSTCIPLWAIQDIGVCDCDHKRNWNLIAESEHIYILILLKSLCVFSTCIKTCIEAMLLPLLGLGWNDDGTGTILQSYIKYT